MWSAVLWVVVLLTPWFCGTGHIILLAGICVSGIGKMYSLTVAADKSVAHVEAALELQESIGCCTGWFFSSALLCSHLNFNCLILKSLKVSFLQVLLWMPGCCRSSSCGLLFGSKKRYEHSHPLGKLTHDLLVN